MSSSATRASIASIVALLATSACNGNGAIPAANNSTSQVEGTAAGVALPADNTSILKKLKKVVVIGSTVDPTNGDQGPRSISIVPTSYVLGKGEVVCNFDDKTGAAGKGTTIEWLAPKPKSKAETFVQSNDIEGCDGNAVTTDNSVYGAGFTSGLVAGFTNAGSLIKTYGSPLKVPSSDVDAVCPPGKPKCLYSAEYIFVSDARTGGIVKFSVNYYGNPTPIQVASGFAVNKKSGWSALGPSGLAYTYSIDTLYIADGVDNTIVAFTHASELNLKNEIVVEKGGKTFKCLYPSTTCGKLIYSGSPLNAPVAMTLLPNGNLIVANTQGGNTLVELTPAGKVLDTKVVDKSSTAGVFGLAATGTNDSNTVVFYTDTNSNDLYELEP
jgi:hypothetical protein